jgi:hypothetical protein
VGGAGLFLLTSDTLGTASLALTGTESRAALKLADGNGIVRDLTSSVAGDLTWGTELVTTNPYLSVVLQAYATTAYVTNTLSSYATSATLTTQLALKANDSDVANAFAGVSILIDQKQETLTPVHPITVSGSIIACPAAASLVASVSGLSLGSGGGASQRLALYEITPGQTLTAGHYFYGMALTELTNYGLGVGLGFWGGSGMNLPRQNSASGQLPHALLTTAGFLGVGTSLPTERLHVVGNILCSGSISTSTKSFLIDHPDPIKAEQGMKLRHWVTESNEPGGNLMYRKQVNAVQGNNILQMPEFFKHLTSHVMCVASPVRHFGLCWADLDTEDANRILLGTSRAGLYTVIITARRKDHCAATCPQEVEFIPDPPPPPEAGTENFPP